MYSRETLTDYREKFFCNLESLQSSQEEFWAIKDLYFLLWEGLCGDVDRGIAALVSHVNHNIRVAMGKRCVAAGSSSIYRNGVYRYSFPKDPIKRKKWEDQVRRTRDK